MVSRSAAPLLFLPPLLCDESIWAPQLSGLADFDPVAVDDYGEASTLPDMAAYALERAPRLFSMVGHSMGARVALEVWRMAPERVERIALLDTGVHPPGPGEAEKRYALLELGRAEGIDRLVEEWLPPMVRPEVRGDEAFMKPLREMAAAGGV